MNISIIADKSPSLYFFLYRSSEIMVYYLSTISIVQLEQH